MNYFNSFLTVLCLFLFSSLASASVGDSFYYCIQLPYSQSLSCFGDVPDSVDASAFDLYVPADGSPNTVKIFRGKPSPLGESNFGPVVAFNTPKDVYALGDNVELEIAVLDEFGSMVCDAEVVVSVESPTGDVITLPVSVSDTCSVYGYVTEPDFSAYFIPKEYGVYVVTVSALDMDFSKNVVVAPNPPFTVERKAPTRLYPIVEYPITLTVFFLFYCCFTKHLVECRLV